MASAGIATLKRIAAKLRWFSAPVYGAIPVGFASAFNIDESVERLSAISKWFALGRTVAEGDVSKHFVSLHKPYHLFTIDLRGGFEPYFKGAFSEHDGRVRLVGRFTPGLAAKVFATVWFGLIVLWMCVAITFLFLGDPRIPWWFPFAGAGMLALGSAHVMVGKWWARDDISWLSKQIEDALSGES
jgi:hypothetical protein